MALPDSACSWESVQRLCRLQYLPAVNWKELNITEQEAAVACMRLTEEKEETQSKYKQSAHRTTHKSDISRKQVNLLGEKHGKCIAWFCIGWHMSLESQDELTHMVFTLLALPPATCFMLVSCLAHFSILKTVTTCSSEMSVNFQRTTRRYIPKENLYWI
jgi:hypothetical protein